MELMLMVLKFCSKVMIYQITTYQIEKLIECIVNIKNWMTNNFLLLNSEKTEVLIIGPKNHKSNNLEHCLTLDGCSLNSSVFHHSSISQEPRYAIW